MKELILNIVGRLGGRKFLAALAGVVVLGLKNYLQLDEQSVTWIGGLIVAYIGGQSVADGWSGGATSTTARMNQADGKLPLILFCLLLPFVLNGCSYVQAQKTVNTMELCAIANQQKRDAIDEAFIADYRANARAQADKLAADAIKAECDATGKANAVNLQIILQKKGEQYAQIEARIIEMRAKIVAANLDMANLLQYNAQLKSYFKQQADAGQLLNQGSAQIMDMLQTFLQGKAKQ